jgi:DNA-binding response OmpR family regulator
MYPAETHILVVESDMRRRQQTERLLTDDGLVVSAVGEGFSAIRAAAGCRFALVIISLDLPGALDGGATLRQLRQRQPWLKALFVGPATAQPQWLDSEREDFIAAPIYRRELLGCVFELLQRDGHWTRAG